MAPIPPGSGSADRRHALPVRGARTPSAPCIEEIHDATESQEASAAAVKRERAWPPDLDGELKMSSRSSRQGVDVSD